MYAASPLASEAAITAGDPNNFITTWDTRNLSSGSTPNNQIKLFSLAGGSSYDIYWENVASSSINGTVTTNASGPTLTLPAPGIYRVEIAGTVLGLNFLSVSNDKQKILEVNQWGNIQWTTIHWAFYNASNLRIPATDAPDLSNVTNMSYMFLGASSFNDPIDHWNVSNITTMYQTFRDATSFNQPLNSWDTSKVTNMTEAFTGAVNFDQSLASWDISSVIPSFISGMIDMLSGTRLSTANQDATLASWASQAVDKNITDISFHSGLKSYSQTGADAIGILQGLGWTITEQYSATYNVTAPATLTGEMFQIRPIPPTFSQSTTPVTVNTPPQCSFLGWSDGNASTTRSDVLVDNLSVSANVDCTPKSSGQFVIKQSIYNEIALSIGSSLVLSPSIPGVTGGVSSGDLPFNVKTNNSLGYQVSLSFAQVVPFRHLLIPSSYIFNYVPQVVGVPDYNLVTPTKSHGFAYSVYSDNATQLFRHSGSTCGVGSDNTLGKCWFNKVDASVPTTIVERNSATGAEGATSTLQFRVVVDQNATPMLLEGEYQATVTVTVLPL